MKDESEGWILVHRSLWKSETFEDEPFSKREAWIWMIAHAAWKDTELEYRGQMIPVRRGQLFYSVRKLAEVFGWSKSSIQRFINQLVVGEKVGTQTGTYSGTNSGTVRNLITICNYDKYQDGPKNLGQTLGHDLGQTLGHKRKNNTLSSLRSERDAGASPDVVLFQTARSVLGEKHIGSVTKLRNKVGDAQAQAILDAAREKADPVSYFYGALKSARPALTQGEIAGGIYYDSQGRKRCTL